MIVKTRVLDGVRGRGFDYFAFRPKSKVYPEQRVCAEPYCATVLSKYNSHDKCWTHIEGAPVKAATRGRHS